jgi:hypothetical protein
VFLIATDQITEIDTCINSSQTSVDEELDRSRFANLSLLTSFFSKVIESLN